MHRRPFAAEAPSRSSGPPKARRGAARPPFGREERPQDLLFLPMGYEPGYRYPLVVWIPDFRGGDPGRFDLGRSMSLLSLRNYTAVLPLAGLGLDPERGVWRAIDRACREANVHPDRIYLVGDRSGGTEAFRVGCRNPGAFAGVVSLGGGFPLGEAAFSMLSQVRRLPMLLCCHREGSAGSIDRPSMDGTLRLFHAAGGSLSVRIYPERRTLSRGMLGDVDRWIMEDVCGAARTSIPLQESR